MNAPGGRGLRWPFTPPLMRTLDPAHPTARLARDLALLWRIAGMLVQYLVGGARIRREYRRREAKGEMYWVDGSGPTRHREEPLHRR